jgi:hypothetical protein
MEHTDPPGHANIGAHTRAQGRAEEEESAPVRHAAIQRHKDRRRILHPPREKEREQEREPRMPGQRRASVLDDGRRCYSMDGSNETSPVARL